jgi:tRNA threonylcarbamoyladenosine biosynthesis protein TsaB
VSVNHVRTLVIDSATEACSVALFEGGALIAGEFRVLGRGHAEQLIPMIARLPGKGQAPRIAVSLGPGSFTGARIGLAAARTLGVAWQAEVAGYPTLALVAAMARQACGAQAVSICMTAGHGQWFTQQFAVDGSAQSPLSSLDPAAAALAANHHLVAGNQAESLVKQRGWGVALPLLPDAQSFLALPPEWLMAAHSPLYGRAPDARLPASSA